MTSQITCKHSLTLTSVLRIKMVERLCFCSVSEALAFILNIEKHRENKGWVN